MIGYCVGAGLTPLSLQAKEGLALINGTQLIASLGAEAIVRAKRIARQADVVAALTIEALKASATPFHPAIHQARVSFVHFIFCWAMPVLC